PPRAAYCAASITEGYGVPVACLTGATWSTFTANVTVMPVGTQVGSLEDDSLVQAWRHQSLLAEMKAHHLAHQSDQFLQVLSFYVTRFQSQQGRTGYQFVSSSWILSRVRFFPYRP